MLCYPIIIVLRILAELIRNDFPNLDASWAHLSPFKTDRIGMCFLLAADVRNHFLSMTPKGFLVEMCNLLMANTHTPWQPCRATKMRRSNRRPSHHLVKTRVRTTRTRCFGPISETKDTYSLDIFVHTLELSLPLSSLCKGVWRPNHPGKARLDDCVHTGSYLGL